MTFLQPKGPWDGILQTSSLTPCLLPNRGQRGLIAWLHVAAALCCPSLVWHPWGPCHKAEGDEMRPGLCWHSLCSPP